MPKTDTMKQTLSDEWEKTYGFPHLCSCEEDIAEGKIVEVPECYFQMTVDALELLRSIKERTGGITFN